MPAMRERHQQLDQREAGRDASARDDVKIVCDRIGLRYPSGPVQLTVTVICFMPAPDVLFEHRGDDRERSARPCV